MEIFKEVLANIKISLYINKNNIIYKAIIENYESILNFDEQQIVFEKYTLTGNNLKIVKMEEKELEVYGEIKEFKVN